MKMPPPERGAIPPEKPSAARVYNYLLGGHHNFAIDRLAAEHTLRIYPDAARAAHANRAFLRRALTFLLDQGLDQFLDLGSGIPSMGNVHELVERANPTARVVYVDIDPIAVAHSEAILHGKPNAGVAQADVRQIESMLNHATMKDLLDFNRPIAALLVALLHFIPDDAEAYRIVHTLRDALPSGSFIVISHLTHEHAPPDVMQQLETLSLRSTNPARARSRRQIEPFFDGLELVDPGLVLLPLWRPEGSSDVFLDEPQRVMVFAGVGHKR